MPRVHYKCGFARLSWEALLTVLMTLLIRGFTQGACSLMKGISTPTEYIVNDVKMKAATSEKKQKRTRRRLIISIRRGRTSPAVIVKVALNPSWTALPGAAPLFLRDHCSSLNGSEEWL